MCVICDRMSSVVLSIVILKVYKYLNFVNPEKAMT